MEQSQAEYEKPFVQEAEFKEKTAWLGRWQDRECCQRKGIRYGSGSWKLSQKDRYKQQVNGQKKTGLI